MDLKEYFRDTEAQGLGAVRAAQRTAYGWWERLRWYQKPSIAMVNGWCFGGGYAPCTPATWPLRPRRPGSGCLKSTGVSCPAAAPRKWSPI